ncbi:MAG: glycoside hydrolase family 32 protein [Bryobacterales bacterium]|nr:glycoside hydrolase family 32 protein [Bryobacterales bacterium]
MNRRSWLSRAGWGLTAFSEFPLWAQQDRGDRVTHHSVKESLPFPSDIQRPRYHFLPPRNWMNDPNGLAFYKGEYHVFYQHNPSAAVWGDMHWGHAASRDLLQWRHFPIALAPTPGGYDKDGVFSGCMVVDGESPTLIYTGTQPEVQAIATSSHPRLETWSKWEGNPVIPAPPIGLEVTGFRDPFVWKEGPDWLMALGSGQKGRGGAILLYRSADLRSWEYLHPLVASDDPALGTMWECPNFFPLGAKHVLLFSPIPLRKALYMIGSYKNRRFEMESVGSLDDGGHFYAPQVFTDGANRRVMFGWSWEGRTEEAQVQSGWAGALTLPRVVTLDPDGKLRTEPHPLCARLLQFSQAVRSAPIGEQVQEEIAQAGIAGNAGRLDVTLEPGDAREVALIFYASPDGREETQLLWRKESGELVIDRSKSSLSSSQNTQVFQAPLKLGKGESLRLTLYLDRSLVEVYANGNCCLTTRVYPSLRESLGIRVSANGKKAILREMVWRPIAMQVS